MSTGYELWDNPDLTAMRQSLFGISPDAAPEDVTLDFLTGTNAGDKKQGNQDQSGQDGDPDAFAKARLADQRKSMIAALRGIMDTYGMAALMDQITGWVQEGFDESAVMSMIRQTDTYKQRFPAMAALNAKNRGISEAEYIAYEKAAQGYERMYGLPKGMLDNPDSIARLLTNEVSADELQNRVVMAATGAMQTDPAVKQTFKDYYGIDEGGLTAYFLDPDKAMPLLNKQYVSSQIGAAARDQQFDLSQQFVEDLQAKGLTAEGARQGMAEIGGQRGLTTGRGDVTSNETLAKAGLMGDAAAKQEVARVAGSRTGRFQGGGQFLQTNAGTVGLGSATT